MLKKVTKMKNVLIFLFCFIATIVALNISLEKKVVTTAQTAFQNFTEKPLQWYTPSPLTKEVSFHKKQNQALLKRTKTKEKSYNGINTAWITKITQFIKDSIAPAPSLVLSL